MAAAHVIVLGALGEVALLGGAAGIISSIVVQASSPESATGLGRAETQRPA